MEQVRNYYKKFVKEGFDENGILNKFEIDCPDNFNFGYDIIDKLIDYLKEKKSDSDGSDKGKILTILDNIFK